MGATAAHVLGHILNMEHDDNGKSDCIYMCVVLFLASTCVSQFDISVIFGCKCVHVYTCAYNTNLYFSPQFYANSLSYHSHL